MVEGRLQAGGKPAAFHQPLETLEQIRHARQFPLFNAAPGQFMKQGRVLGILGNQLSQHL